MNHRLRMGPPTRSQSRPIKGGSCSARASARVIAVTFRSSISRTGTGSLPTSSLFGRWRLEFYHTLKPLRVAPAVMEIPEFAAALKAGELSAVNVAQDQVINGVTSIYAIYSMNQDI